MVHGAGGTLSLALTIILGLKLRLTLDFALTKSLTLTLTLTQASFHLPPEPQVTNGCSVLHDDLVSNAEGFP